MRMPLLATAYGVFMSVIMIAGTHQALEAQRPYWLIGVGVAHSVVLLFLFIGHWTQQLVRPLGPLALLLFVCCLASPLINIPGLLRDIDAPELGPALNRLHKALWLTIGLIGDFPAYWFGGIAAWRAL